MNDTDDEGAPLEEEMTVHKTWSGISAGDGECVYLVFDAFFPWPLWTLLASYTVLNAHLVVSALYK